MLLLDDIFDKLDEKRVEALMALVGDEGFGQLFITDTHPQRIPKIFKKKKIEHQLFRIEAGNVKS